MAFTLGFLFVRARPTAKPACGRCSGRRWFPGRCCSAATSPDRFHLSFVLLHYFLRFLNPFSPTLSFIEISYYACPACFCTIFVIFPPFSFAQSPLRGATSAPGRNRWWRALSEGTKGCWRAQQVGKEEVKERRGLRSLREKYNEVPESGPRRSCQPDSSSSSSLLPPPSPLSCEPLLGLEGTIGKGGTSPHFFPLCILRALHS